MMCYVYTAVWVNVLRKFFSFKQLNSSNKMKNCTIIEWNSRDVILNFVYLTIEESNNSIYMILHSNTNTFEWFKNSD